MKIATKSIRLLGTLAMWACAMLATPALCQQAPTVAGGGVGDNGPANAAIVNYPQGLWIDTNGDVLLADAGNNRVRRIDTGGIITTIAGNGQLGGSVGGELATATGLNSPSDIVRDTQGSLVIAEPATKTLRFVNSTGQIGTIAGEGSTSFTGITIPASDARLGAPVGVAVDAAGTLYFTDVILHRVIKITTDGMMVNVAGVGIRGFSGDGGAAITAAVDTPTRITVDAVGNIYFVDSGNIRVRKIDTNGRIDTIAGTGQWGISADGTIATAATLAWPDGLAVDSTGRLLIAESGSERVRRIESNGSLSTVAGSGELGFNGDGILALDANIGHPSDIALDSQGNLYISETQSQRVRMVDLSGIVQTIAGTGSTTFSGDGGQAKDATLASPMDVAVFASGGYVIADRDNHRIRSVSAEGDIRTIAGNGSSTFSGDGGNGLLAGLKEPSGIAIDSDGSVVFVDFRDSRVRRVRTDGIISTIAGDGVAGFNGDGPATSSHLSNPISVALDAAGNIYIADTSNQRIRKVTPNGMMSTVAGTGVRGGAGDGGPATAAQLDQPSDVAIGPDGLLYIADTRNNRIRMVSADGTITTFAGTGATGIEFSGDGGPARNANIPRPFSITFDSAGTLYISLTGTNVLRVDTRGILTAVPINLGQNSENLGIAARFPNELLIATGRDNRIRSIAVPTSTPQPPSGPELSIADVSILEGDDESVVAQFVVTLSAPAPLPVMFDIATFSDGDARADADFVPRSVIGAAIAAGQSSYAFDVLIVGDTIPEPLETFRVSVSNVIGAKIVDGDAVAFIRDNDPSPKPLILFPPMISEGNSGSSDAVFLIQLGQTAATDVTFDADTIEGTATAGSDYLPLSISRIVIPAGSLIATVTVSVLGDLIYEGNETFSLKISNIRGVDSGDLVAVATIFDDDPPPPSPPVLTIGDSSIDEGDAGTVELAFPVTLSRPTDKPVIFDAVTSDLSATSGWDYVAQQVHGMAIPAGTSRVEIRVTIIPDTDVEPSETFRVTLSNVVGAVADNLRAIGTINNDDVATDTIQTIAGTGTAAFSGDNGPAVQAAISFPAAIAIARDGTILFADARNHRIRRIAVDGTIDTIAGNGSVGFSGDGGPAQDAALNFPTGLAIDGQGRVFIADTINHRVRMIATDGTISTIAGGSVGAFAGDGGPAVNALLRSPGGIAVDLSGNLYVADAGNARVRRIDTNGLIVTIAGNGSFGSSGDAGPALEAGLVPAAVAVDAANNVYVTEADSRRVRRIDSKGVIWPFLGDGNAIGSNGDGGPALSASLRFPVGAVVDAEGNVYVTDVADNRIRKVSTEGIVSTVAGGGPGTGFSGDGGPAVNASLFNPRATAVDTAGNIFIADSNNQRIRRVGAKHLALDAADRFVWFVPPADDVAHQGFLRISNPQSQPVTASFWGIDEEGVRSPGTIVATLPASGSLQFNSIDLALGNEAKGLSGRLGEGLGSWTLVTRSSATLEPTAYIRTPDGFLTSMHDRVEGDGVDWWVPMFNPANNPNQVSHLRLVNTESNPVSLLIEGIDDTGQPGTGSVATTLPSLSALDLSASDLELGNIEKGLAGHLGQGNGKWQLHLSSTGRIVAQSQLLDPNGNITNLSTIADDIGQAPGQRTLWFFPAASDVQHQGFVRLINREARSGQVRVWGVDDAGTTSPGAITLTLAPNESRQFNSQDAAFGNPLKGLDGSLGAGTGDWRLIIASDLDLQAMAFIRTPDGFLTSMHDVGPIVGTSLRIPIFNPAQNPDQVSWLRLINPNGFAVTTLIDGIDDSGVRASGHVSLTLPAHAAIEISAADLEAGNPALGLSGSLGDGEGKWVLEVTTSAPIKAISLLRDPRGFITNLSRDARTSSRLDP